MHIRAMNVHLLLSFLAVGATVFFLLFFGDKLLLAWSEPEYSHGPLVPLVSALVLLKTIHNCRDSVLSAAPQVLALLLSLTGLSLLLFAVGEGEIYTGAAGLCAYFAGLLASCFNLLRAPKIFLAPMIMLFSVPLPDATHRLLSEFMESQTMHLLGIVFGVIGVPVYFDGQVIDLGVAKFLMNEEGSGFRFLMPIYVMTFALIAVWDSSPWKLFILASVVLPLVLFFNAIRICAYALFSIDHGDVSDSFYLFYIGWTAYFCCNVSLVVMIWVLDSFRGNGRGVAANLDLTFWRLRPTWGSSSHPVGRAVHFQCFLLPLLFVAQAFAIWLPFN